ncbi:MAG: glycosyltransferase [Patescibacteria group bacterium]|nr:glycosyltransferase [Patescibacteria group bacterium]
MIEKRRMKNVLFYAVNGLGLGHLTRLLSIARQMQKIDDTIQPLFLTTSEACHVLYAHKIPYFKLPSKTYLKENTDLKRKDLAMMYNLTVMNLVNTYNPVAIVVDTFPVGSLDDLLGVLSMKTSMKKIFIHREQKDMSKQKIGLQNFYNLIITPHLENTTKIPVPNGKKLVWAGNIMVRENDEVFTKEEVLKKFNLPTDKKIVLLSLGGGGDKTTEIEYKKITSILLKRDDLHIVVPKSPLSTFDVDLYDNMTQIEYYPLIEIMNVFDVAISATGYNTFHELMYMGVPSIFIPKLRGLDDQEARALSVEEYRAGFCLYEDNIEKELEYKVDLLLKYRKEYSLSAKYLVKQNGASVAANAIYDLIGGEK